MQIDSPQFTHPTLSQLSYGLGETQLHGEEYVCLGVTEAGR